MVNETTLRIKDLQMEDSGAYRARVSFVTKHFQDQTFLLTVYEPVPEPKILPRKVSNTPYGCNVTLQCQVSGKGEFNISWRRGNPLRDLEFGSDWFQLSNNGKDLHLSWWLNSSEPNFTCLVTNPADQKNISFSVLNICQTRGENILMSWVSLRVTIILLGVLVQITIVTLVNIFGRK
ncbi:SLAM family member 5-like [Zootoca vivipara]|uniref:SLAM family member 5-like n=1 Tax=Zootoca vivipara TaxID=8524 RepID=UPI00293BB95A|nr:SLAM family member 5-like [Zootoca vivipara]